MREIKFRAWDKTQEKIFYNSEGQPEYQDGWKVSDVGLVNYMLSEPEYLDWMQYTGLKDKNGVEIYEGDIVRFNDMYEYINFGGGIDTHSSRVFYKDGLLLPFYAPGGIDCQFPCDIDSVEVIGNIYQNKNLLEK